MRKSPRERGESAAHEAAESPEFERGEKEGEQEATLRRGLATVKSTKKALKETKKALKSRSK
jgi:hypothetical protein